MSRILIVDDTQFWREVTSDALRNTPYTISTAADAPHALDLLRSNIADLIILDIDLPEIPGLALLQFIRNEAQWKDIPVIMLTGDMEKEHVLLAKKLGVVDYVLKSRFSPQQLLDRVQKRLNGTASAGTGPAHTASQEAPAEKKAPVLGGHPVPFVSLDQVPQLLNRERCLARAHKAMSGRTLPGVVAEVIASASSPRVALSDLAQLVGRDAILSSRVLAAANSAANVVARGTISTLPDAVKIVGSMNIRNIATAVGVFDPMPEPERDGFDPIRSWQHSLAVARISEHLAPQELKGNAYLVGLCHDLGEILFRSHFGKEYRQVLEQHRNTGLPLFNLETQMLGAAHGEISREIIQFLGLPEAISRPITQFHHPSRMAQKALDPLSHLLCIADAYASGLLIAASTADGVRCFSQFEMEEATGQTHLSASFEDQFRSEIFSLTSVYGRLSAEEQKTLAVPILASVPAKVLIIRDQGLSDFDPVTACLQSLAEVTVTSELPQSTDVFDFQSIVVLARTTHVLGLLPGEIEEFVSSKAIKAPVLFVTGKKEESASRISERIKIVQWPIPISELAGFLQSCV